MTAQFVITRVMIVAALAISPVPLYAQAQQPDMNKLKADAQKVVNIVRADKAKTRAYCQISSLGGEIDLAAQSFLLVHLINDLEKTTRSRIPRAVRRTQ